MGPGWPLLLVIAHHGVMVVCVLPPMGSNRIADLHRHILRDYDRHRRPGTVLQPVEIVVRLSPLSLVEMDEAKGQAKLQFGVDLEWMDERLTWWYPGEFYENFYNLSTTPRCILVPLKKIWAPRDVQYVFVVDQMMTLSSECYVCHDGTVSAVAFVSFSTPVSFHTENFPFDSQNILTTFGHNFVGLQEVNVSIKTQSLYEAPHEIFHAAWILGGYSCERRVQKNPGSTAYALWPYIECKLTIRRDPGFYLVNFCAPSVTTTVLAVVGIHSAISPESRTRMSKYELALVTLLSTSVQLLSISESLPRTGTVSRLHVLYFGLTFAVLMSAFVAWATMKLDQSLHRNSHRKLIVDLVERASLIFLLGSIYGLLVWFVRGS